MFGLRGGGERGRREQGEGRYHGIELSSFITNATYLEATYTERKVFEL